jgi:thioesterase domain-containing protein
LLIPLAQLTARLEPPQKRQIFEDPTYAWGTIAAGGVEVHTVPGSHMTILEAPHVETLARILGACIERAERESGQTVCLVGAGSSKPTGW